jgi:MerR family transcriptional regulator, light-induced transcriptional regulator
MSALWTASTGLLRSWTRANADRDPTCHNTVSYAVPDRNLRCPTMGACGPTERTVCRCFVLCYVLRTMYTIRQAALRSGVSVPLLRAWERRYRIVEPARTASGYRLYDEESLDRLRAMRHLVEDGWTPSTAAAHLREGGDEVVRAIVRPAGGTAVNPGAELAVDPAPALAEAFVDAASGMDEARLEAVLDEMFARGSFEQVTQALLMPGLVGLGEAWAAGRATIAAEHSAANAVARRLGAAFLAAGRPNGEEGIVLVGLPPGSRHELGALAFATALRRAGTAVRYLGADLPVPDWIEAASQTKAEVAVVGVIIPGDAGRAKSVAAALRVAHPEILIAFGGGAAGRVRIAPEADILRLPEQLTEAVEALRSAIESRAASGSTSPRTA